MAQHRPSKPAPVEYSTDEEDMIVYDVDEDAIESNPDYLPSHVGIICNEQADSAAKSATTHLPLAVPLSDMKRVIMHHIFKIWQESWSQQLDNKLHSVKPVIGAWPVMPMRRTDVKLTCLRIGHTRFTHRHLLFGERALNVLHAMSLTLLAKIGPCAIKTHHHQTIGEPKSVKKLKSGDLLLKTNSAVQSKSYLSAKTFLDSPLLVTPHKYLNSSPRRNHRQRASGQRGKVGDDPSAARSSAIGYEARHLASYFSDLAGIMESAVG
ncbi:putative RNA-directed DNA polymerase from transposon X-element [Trichonephila clavipes]|nr:putative RNA-directed DNA polymerase from transposon X-element [Trichonephila clavipes]